MQRLDDGVDARAGLIDEVRAIAERLAKASRPVMLLLNKSDLIDPQRLLPLAKELNDGVARSPESMRVLLIDRNKRWADWIAARMAQPGTVFIAVGAGHLAGKNSVQRELASRGVKTQRVKY